MPEIRRLKQIEDENAKLKWLVANAVARNADSLAFADTLSLLLCGALAVVPKLKAAGRAFEVTTVSGVADTYSIAPRPFMRDYIAFENEARALPPSGRLMNEPACGRGSLSRTASSRNLVSFDMESHPRD